MPAISVIMPAYNAGRFVNEAIDSILNQTFTDFEFIIIDDGSTDDTAAILASYEDARLRVIRSPQNEGITPALNRGLDAATAPLIARMDADDISHPQRLAIQRTYFATHPEVGLLSSSVRFINEAGKPTRQANQGIANSVSEHYLRWRLLWHNPIIHSTVMLRRDALGGNRYNPTFIACEDYDLWVRLIHYTHITHLHDILLDYRFVGNSINRTQGAVQKVGVRRIIERELTHYLGSDLPADGLTTLSAYITNADLDQPDYAGAAVIMAQAGGHMIQNSADKADKQRILADTLTHLRNLYEHSTHTQPTAIKRINTVRRRFEMRYNPQAFALRQLRRFNLRGDDT